MARACNNALRARRRKGADLTNGNARFEIEPGQVHRRKHDVGNTAFINVRVVRSASAVVAKDAIKRMDAFLVGRTQ